MFKEDDWLEEELRFESKLSPWRFDSTAADIRKEHEENCDPISVSTAPWRKNWREMRSG